MPEAALLCLEPPFYVWSRPFMPGLEPPFYAWSRPFMPGAAHLCLEPEPT